MKANIIAAVGGIVLGAVATSLIAQKQLGSAVTTSLGRFGVPAALLGNGDAFTTLQNLDPQGADDLKMAWIEAAGGGAAAAVVAYILISNLMGHP